MSLFFDEASYLRSKLSLMSAEEKAEKNISTTAELKAYMANAGLTPQDHYNLFGRNEGLNPNSYFNEKEYLEAKLQQLHSVNERDSNGQPYTLETLKETIASSGMTPLEHYERYGAYELNADGTLINPSNAFDANAYAAAKLYQLQNSTDKAEAAAWADKTPADVIEAIKEAGMSPVTHYLAYGADEANGNNIALVQTVPSEQRVSNDPLRDQLGQNVPSNYNPPSEGPAKANPEPVGKPADMGDLANHTISPQAVSPTEPVKVPGDTGYIAPPANIRDTTTNPVIPPTTSGTGNVSDNWLVVNSTSSAIVVDKDGTILGEVNVSTNDDGTVTVPPNVSGTPSDKLPAVDPDDLPPNVNPGNTDDNIKPDTPDVPTPTPDTTAPNMPTINVADDNIIDRSEMLAGVKITGTAEVGSKIEVIISDENNNNITIPTITASDGNYSVTLSHEQIKSLKDGTLNFRATATDAAGNTSQEITHTVELNAELNKTFSAAGGSDTALGLEAPKGFQSNPPTLKELLDELQKVYDIVTDSNPNNDYKDVSALETDAPNFAKLVHFYDNNYTVNKPATANGNSNSIVNIAAHDLYGGGLALSLKDLNDATGSSGRVEALKYILSKAKFDLPTIQATSTDYSTVTLEVDRVGSTIDANEFPLNSGLLDQDLTFAKAVELVSAIKPIAVEANAKELDIHLAPSGSANIVNLMEVRGNVEEITFSGTKGRFGINVDAHDTSTPAQGTVTKIDASSLTDEANSGVYVNTAPINVTVPLGSNQNSVSMGFNAAVGDHLDFKGSAGDDLLVVSTGTYEANGTTLDGGNGDDTLVLISDAKPNGFIPATTTVEYKGMSGFENLALVNLGELGNNIFKIDNASSFTDVKQFITTSDLTIAGLNTNTEISVVGLLDMEAKLDLAAQTQGSSITLNLAMTDNFLMHLDVLMGGPSATPTGKAILTNADKISNLILTGKDANAYIALGKDALSDIAKENGSITATDFSGHIQVEDYKTGNGVTYGNYTTQTANAGVYFVANGGDTYLVYNDGQAATDGDWAVQISGVNGASDIVAATL